MDFITKRTKTWFLFSLIAFALAIVLYFFSFLGNIVNLGISGYGMNIVYIITMVLSMFVAVLLFAAFGVTSFFAWKKEPNKLLFLICSGVLLLYLFLTLVVEIILAASIRFYSFRFGALFFNGLPYFLLAAYMVVFTFIKMEGPVPAIIGAGISGLSIVIYLCTTFVQFIRSVVNMFRYFNFNTVLSLFTNSGYNLATLLFWVGVLLLVPLAFYQAKKAVEAAAEPTAAIEE